MKKVSIILRTFNRADFLPRAIKSVIFQTYKNWELIIIDNFSTDSTKEVIFNFHNPQIKYLKYRNNGNIAAAFNFGLRESIGDYIAILDSDDWWSLKKLEKSVTKLNQGADFVYHDMLYAKANKKINIFSKTYKSRKLKSPIIFDLLHNGPAIINSSVVVRKKILVSIHGFSEDINLYGSEDYDAWIRLSRKTEKFVYLPYPLGFYSWGNENLTSNLKIIKSLKYITKNYHKELKFQKPSVFNYITGVCFYKDKKYKYAQKYFIKYLKKPSNIIYFLLSIKFIFLILFKKYV